MKFLRLFLKTAILTLLLLCSLILQGLFLNTDDWKQANAETVDKNALENKITAKEEELKRINQQINEQKIKLDQTQSQKNTLTNEVKKIDINIKQIDLGVQASRVIIDRLDLQIKTLQGDISEAESDILQKQAAVNEILRQIQDKDNENPLIVFLKNETLSDGVLEIQSLTDLNNTLNIKISELDKSKKKLSDVLNQASTTKEAKEVEHQTLQNKKEIASDLKQEKQKFLQETKNKEKTYQDSIKQLEQQQLAIANEIEKIESQLRSQINYKNLPKNIPGLLATPVPGRVTQEHGSTKFARSAYKSQWHNGTDFAASIGTPVISAAEGVVVSTDNQDLYCRKGAYGKYVAIKHYNGLTTLYAHLSLYKVREGDKVERGQIIGYSGNTGYATGSHLHFGVYDSETFYIDKSKSCGPKMPFGGDLNPRNYLSI